MLHLPEERYNSAWERPFFIFSGERIKTVFFSPASKTIGANLLLKDEHNAVLARLNLSIPKHCECASFQHDPERAIKGLVMLEKILIGGSADPRLPDCLIQAELW